MTAGYHWHFCHPPILLLIPFEKMKMFSLFTIHQSSLFFLLYNFFNFFRTKNHNWGGRDISKKYYHLIRILQKICRLHRDWKNSKFYFKKDSNSVCKWNTKPNQQFLGNFVAISWVKPSKSEPSGSSAISKWQVNVRKHTRWADDCRFFRQ